MSAREALFLTIDEGLLAQIDALARQRGITRHDAARLVLQIGVELLQRNLKREVRR